MLERALGGPPLILHLVDEYTLYCHYTEIPNLTPRTSYFSPVRREEYPSFSFWEINNSKIEYLWKDSGIGESGNIFKLIKLMFGYKTYKEVYQRIDTDFDLGFYNDTADLTKKKIIQYEKITREASNIRISSVPFSKEDEAYWSQYHISQETRKRYNVTAIRYVWFYEDQKYPTYTGKYTYAYRIGKHYQIYKPFEDKKHKFRNDFPSKYVMGFMQLPKEGDVLIIDKSMKDVMFCHEIGYNAVAGKSETTLIHQDIMMNLKERFKKIYLMLDPDQAGKRQTEKYLELYDWLEPKFLTNAKDKTDLCAKVGYVNAVNEIKSLLI